MNAKLKNANPAVRFLLQHGEKIGMAAILVVAGLLIFKSLGREKLGEEHQPERLRTQAEQADSQVRRITWEDLDDPTKAANFIIGKERVVLEPVDPPSFPRFSETWNEPIIPPAMPRTDPVLLTVEDLEVTTGAGLWLDSDPQVIKQKMLDAAKEAAAEERERREEAERMAREDEERGRGGRGRGEGGYGGYGEGRGGYGEMGNLGGMRTRDGAIILSAAGGAQMQGFEDIRQESWATVLAKVPIKQQFDMYEDALAEAKGFSATNDMPRYFGYEVQRAEVTEEGLGPWTRIDAVNAPKLVTIMQRWPIQTPEIANPKYTHPLLTHPLPPMVMRSWDERVTHSDMPLPTPEDLMGGPEVAEDPSPEPEKDEEPLDPDSPFGSALKPMQPGEMGGYGRGGEMGMPMGGYGRGGEMGMPMGGYGGRGEMGMPMGGYGGRGEMGMGGYGGRGEMGGYGGYAMGMGSGLTELATKDWDMKTKFWMFRYFDKTVQPGHRYRYRVRLFLIDVNATQPPNLLSAETNKRLAEEKAARNGKLSGYRSTDWSEPSPVAVVPQIGLIHVAGLKPGSANSEAEARLVVKSLDANLAAEVAISDYFPRGSVVNKEQKAHVIRSSVYKPDPEKKEESPTFDFLSGLTVLDFEGGEQLASRSRDLLAPARVLVMDSAGRLRTQNELEDEPEVRQYDAIMKAAKEAAAREREREDGGGRGGRGGYER